MLEVNCRQLHRDGLTHVQVVKAITNMHPRLMKNLKVRLDGFVSVKNTKLRWVRRLGWTKNFRYCRSCEQFRDKNSFMRGGEMFECITCRAYKRERRRWAAEFKRGKA